ncbi:MAG: hypothetical protein ABFR97_09925 [Thermodesulfobacteriota bacterium]
MRILACCTVVLAQLFFAAGAQALDESDFDGTEYSFGINEPENLKMAPRSLGEERSSYYDFINFEDGNKEKWATYLDTPDRKFKENSLIIRVREDRKKAHKTKITVKLRAATPAKFGKLKNYKKAEIDVSANGTKKYSVSYDIKFDPTEIDVRKVDVEAIFAQIKKKSPDAWNLVKDLYKKHGEEIEQTIVMRALGWEGQLKGYSGNLEVDYAIWSPYRYSPRRFLAEVSFKGKTGDAGLKKAAAQIKADLQKKGIYADVADSKTQATFDMSPNFNK